VPVIDLTYNAPGAGQMLLLATGWCQGSGGTPASARVIMSLEAWRPGNVIVGFDQTDQTYVTNPASTLWFQGWTVSKVFNVTGAGIHTLQLNEQGEAGSVGWVCLGKLTVQWSP
jgi:hypothetical protein